MRQVGCLPSARCSVHKLHSKSVGSCKGFRAPLNSGHLSINGFEELNSIKHSKY